MPWQIEFRAGVWLPQIDWWLDAHFPVARSFVSHAHSDHTALHREILCSAGTAQLMQARLPGERVEHILPFGQTEQLTPDCTVTLHPAGHIFGSAQSLLTHREHGTLLYTGDFKLRRGLSAEPCETPQADTLIMETTFGRPQYVFPPTAQVLRDIAHFCHETLGHGETAVLFGYSLGKSQELLSGLAAAQLPVMLHPQTYRLTKIYEQFGIVFPPYREFSLEELDGHVVICPPQSRESTFVRKIPNRRTAMITGWALDPNAIYRYQCDAAFPLSDHADFPDLLRFVDAVKPQRVLTLHGFTTDFAQTLRERGIEAWAIDEDNQLELGIDRSAGLRPAFPMTNDRGSETRATSAEGDALMSSAGFQPAPPESGRQDACATPNAAPEAFVRFVAVADAVKASPKKLEKTALLQAYLSELSPDDAAIAATFLTGRAFPQRDPRNLTLGWAVIKRAVLEVAGATEADYRAAYHRFADAGDATAAVLQRRVRPPREAEASALALESSTREDNATKHIGPALSSGCSLGDMATFFDRIAATRGPVLKLELLRDRLIGLSADEARYLVKIITGDLRIGLKEGLLEEAIALAAAQPLEAVREAHMLCGDIAKVTRAAKTNQLGSIELSIFNPLQFMLASPVPNADAIVERFAERSATDASVIVGAALRRDGPEKNPASEAPAAIESRHKAAPTPADTNDTAVVPPPRSFPTVPPIWLEEKYDGIRCQLHKAGARVELYSRDLNRITEQFPDLVRAAADIPGDFIADGELLAWRDGRALPFAELQKRLGRTGGDDFFLGTEIPVSISFYDLLWLNGRSLLKEPLSNRRKLLTNLLLALDPRLVAKFYLAPVQHVSTALEIEAAFLAARGRGNEGLMAKDPRSAYTPGRRGLAWLKLKKAYATLDVVVVGVEYGHGKRRDVLSDYTFAIRDAEHDRLLTVGKAYSGLTDKEIAALTQHFLEHTLEVHGRYRAVVPDTVIEVAFDTIQPSNRHQSGFALRFPRIARIRTDKAPAEIDTLETCRTLANAAAGNFAADTSAGGLGSVVAAPDTAREDSAR